MMISFNKKAFLTILLLFICSASLHAQHSLFTVDTSKAIQLSTEKQEYISTVGVQINIPESLSQSEQLSISLPNGENGIFEIIRVAEFIEGVISVSARDINNPYRFVTANWNVDGTMLTNINLHDTGETFHLRYDSQSKSHYLATVDSQMADVLECSAESENPLNDIIKKASEKLGLQGEDPRSMPKMMNNTGQTRYTANASGMTTIDLLLVYTQNAENWANSPDAGGLNNVVAQMMNLSQLALDNSQIPVTLRVVGLRRIEYNDDGNNGPISSGNHLRRLTASETFNPFGIQFSGFMMEVHQWREELGADMVSALMEVSDVGGVAWVGGGPAPLPDLMFSVNRIQQMANTYTFIHELGHNFGLLHSRNQSTAFAGVFGGAFQYSAGWRFTGAQDNNSYATVMTYAEQSERIPVFANPDVNWSGTPTGATSGTFAPADAARSISKTAPYVAGNYPTRFQAPSLDVDTSPIQITMAPNEVQTVNVTLQNNGDSRMYFRPEVRSVALGVTSEETPTLDWDWYERNFVEAPRFPGIGSAPLWGSTFNADLGFTATTNTQVQQDWPAYTRNQQDFYVIEATGVGNQHVKLVHQPHLAANQSMGIRSAYDRFFQFGSYRFNANLRISNPDESNYYIRLFDSSVTSGNTDFAWVAFLSDGSIYYVSGYTQNGGLNLTNTGGTWNPNEFKEVEILYAPESNAVHFFYDNEYLSSTTPLAPHKPLMAQVYRTNNATQSSMDIDEMFMNMVYEGVEFLKATPEAGNINPGLSSTVQLLFDTNGIEPGLYNAEVELYSSDPEKELVTIPVELTITGEVSVPETDQPIQVELSQNYPNPFNPITNIHFQLAETGPVTLEVYNVAGQKIQTLVSGTVNSGSHTVSFDASGLASGLYLYRLQTESTVITKKMMLLK